MGNGLFSVHLSEQSISLRPTETPVSFDVVVVNDSDQLAQFRLDLVAASTDQNFVPNWYSLSPEVSVAKPPGDRTTFTVYIHQSPIANFIGTINLTVKVRSLQLSGEQRKIVRLLVGAGSSSDLILSLPVDQISVYPNNSVDIVVEIKNPNPHPILSILKISGIPNQWLQSGSEKQLTLAPQSSDRTVFKLKPPDVTQALSQIYPFQVEAFNQESQIGTTQGNIEILPIGFIKFAIKPQQQAVPQSPWLPNWTTRNATFQMAFENCSNLIGQVKIGVQGQDWQHCHYIPPNIETLKPGQSSLIPLKLSFKRHWLGWKHRLQLDVTAQNQAENSVDLDPTLQPIQLIIRPIIPLWIIMSFLGMLISIFLTQLQRTPIVTHHAKVNAVRISKNAKTAVSISEDCSIRYWDIEKHELKPAKEYDFEVSQDTCIGSIRNRLGILDVRGQAVRALEFFPLQNDRIAVGLGDGSIELWNLPEQNLEDKLKDKSVDDDQILTLEFTKDASQLFSGHGSGKIRVWNRTPSQQSLFLDKPKILELEDEYNYQVYALAVSEDNTFLISAGSHKTLVFWNLKTSPPQRQLWNRQGDQDFYYDISLGPNNRWLATADSNGMIALWDLKTCDTSHSQQQVNNNARNNCAPKVQWPTSSKDDGFAVRSLKFSEDGSYLVSAGEQGKVVRWQLTETGELNQQKTPPPNGEVLFSKTKDLVVFDFKKTRQGTPLIIGDRTGRVWLHRYQ